ncbi:peptide deformylase [Lysinibacillus sp. B2A1]|nr:peptide deformylase [Lysinibacillus sp. B2A1]
MSKFCPDYMITMKDFVKEGSAILRKKTNEVMLPVAKEDQDVLRCMLQYLRNSQDPDISKKYKLRPGSGLSANQIGLSKRMFAALFEEGNQMYEYMLVNPKIIRHSLNMIYLPEGEGCLSVNRKINGYVPRYERIKVKAYDILGQEIILQFNGYGAILMQHEIDHLNGIMFYDRINQEHPFKLPDNVVIEGLY